MSPIRKTSSRSALGDLERAVMDVLWSQPTSATLTVRDVHAQVAEQRDVAYTTVMTVMDRLARKGHVVQEREGRAYRYRATASRGQMTADLMRGALEDIGHEDRAGALVAFVGEASADEVRALREALARINDDPDPASPGA
ncbi:BlaI/MecI/CopY family transcriptional regulator [Nocardioides zeae]|uniref:BlaI/MecI/CopY family transcriptional regulator n=1 Tax=Nocardioides imazamoxiresistens TaxID=3231893 RepID=A0ABU3PV03_9ACTN|nr:BlaI/MecI/CopY family transcriptional regulator [Nocardioides zeae]MDT9592590.1 BlaI/MecI/CopY family transcriptional regulator [Nocardioides zeae]